MRTLSANQVLSGDIPTCPDCGGEYKFAHPKSLPMGPKIVDVAAGKCLSCEHVEMFRWLQPGQK